MPTYQYACTECGHALRAGPELHRRRAHRVPGVQGRLRKVFNAVGVVFKGSGFYRNDSRDAKASSSAAKSDSEGSGSKADSAKAAGSGSAKSGETGSAGGSTTGTKSEGSKSSSSKSDSSKSAAPVAG